MPMLTSVKVLLFSDVIVIDIFYFSGISQSIIWVVFLLVVIVMFTVLQTV